MSQYLNVFVRFDGKFVPVGSFNRSSKTYGIFGDSVSIPYEKIREFTEAEIMNLRQQALNEERRYQAYIDESNKNIKLVLEANNSMEEKIEYINSYQDDIKDSEAMKGQCIRTKYYADFLCDILDDIKYGEHGDSDVGIIYMGIECPAPTWEDIVD